MARPPVPTPAVSQEYLAAREQATLEPPELKGLVFLQHVDGSTEILKHSGETEPEIPATGPDIPESAVRDGRVVIYVDGIHQMWSEQQRQINYFLHGQAEAGAQVGQTVVGIHEGSSETGFQDGARIAKVLGMLKLVQTGLVPLQWAARKMYRIDPSIKAVHDEVRQSLEAGRQVQLMTHSGGGAETAAALTILSREEGGRFRPALNSRIRLLSLASAASRKDFLKAGLKAENIYYTGSKRDPVHNIFRHHIHPILLPLNLPWAMAAGKYLVDLIKGTAQHDQVAYHSPDYIFAGNQPGQHRPIQAFLEGAPGVSHSLD